MRSTLLVLIILGTLPLILIKPHVGILVWDWIAFMSPHRLTWGFTYDFGFAQIIGGLTIFAWLISREPKRIPWTPVTAILAAFVVWISITTFFALAPDKAFDQWLVVIKIMIMTFITLPLINTKDRLHALLWVIVVSIGFYGVKGGVFVILHGGNSPIQGPPESYIASNNALAGALVMVLPLMRYLQLQAKSRWVALGFWPVYILCILAILSTYSRGGLLALGAMLIVLCFRSRRKLLVGAFVAAGFLAALSLVSDKWYDRAESIQAYEEDWSSMDRIKMWKHGFAIASERPLVGGGFQIFKQRQFYERFGLRICSPGANIQDYCVLHTRASHSIYFDALGEHGFVGFALYLLLLIATFVTGSSIIGMTRGRDDLAWMSQLAAMLQASIVGYATMGLTQNTTYYDLYYTLVVAMVLINLMAKRALNEQRVSKEATGVIPGGAINVIARGSAGSPKPLGNQ